MILLEGRRNGYTPQECGETMTVGKLISYLQEFDEDMKVYLINDNGDTYGSINECFFTEEYEND